jgi:hypothetical protein
MTERDLQRALPPAIFRLTGCSVWRQQGGKLWQPLTDRGRATLSALVRSGDVHVYETGSPAGVADLTGMVPDLGLRVEVEVKSEGGRLRPDQVRWAEFVQSNGGIYVLAKPERGESHEDAVSRSAALVAEAIEERRRELAAHRSNE